MEHTRTLMSLSDEVLLRRLVELLGQSRRVEAEAYLRITVARASRENPILLEMLVDGRLHLSGIATLAPHLNAENRDAVLVRAAHKSKREIEELVAELAPRPDAPALVRKLPQTVQLRPDGVDAGTKPGREELTRPTPAPPAAPVVAAATPPAGPGLVQPLAPARYKVQFTASADLCGKLERLKTLMRSSVPDGDLAAIIEDAVSEKLARLEARRFAQTATPRKSLRGTNTSPKSRYIPAAAYLAEVDYGKERSRSRFGAALRGAAPRAPA